MNRTRVLLAAALVALAISCGNIDADSGSGANAYGPGQFSPGTQSTEGTGGTGVTGSANPNNNSNPSVGGGAGGNGGNNGNGVDGGGIGGAGGGFLIPDDGGVGF